MSNTTFPRIKFNNNVVEHTYDHSMSPVIHRSTILITDTITLKERKKNIKSGARLPKLKVMTENYRHAKPEKPFYSVIHETDTLSPEALAVNKIQKLKSKWKLSDKKSRNKFKRQKKENGVSQLIDFEVLISFFVCRKTKSARLLIKPRDS